MSTKRIDVATFNTYNLVLPGVTYYETRKYSKAQYVAKKTWIKHQIEQMHPDIIGFQEVFHKAALTEILVEIPGLAQAEVYMPAETGTNPCVALASRFPLENPSIIEEFPASAHLSVNDQPAQVSKFQRPIVRATVKIDNGTLDVIVFVVHLKSKRPMIDPGADPDDPLQIALGSAKSLLMRVAEATALRHILVETMRGNTTPVIVMGDINDSVTAVTSEIVSGTPPYKRLSAAKKAAIWDVLLYNVKDLQSEDQPSRHLLHTYLQWLLREPRSHLREQRVRARQSRVSRVCGICQSVQ